MFDKIQSAGDRIAPFIRNTLAEYCPFLGQTISGSVFLKMENQQVSGSFKAQEHSTES